MLLDTFGGGRIMTRKKNPLKKIINEICKQNLFTFVRWLWQKGVPCKSIDIHSGVTHGHSRAHHSIISFCPNTAAGGARAHTHIHPHCVQRHMLCIHIVNHSPFGCLFGIYFCLSLFEVHHILTTRLFYRAHNFLHRINNKKKNSATTTHSSIGVRAKQRRMVGCCVL